MTPQEQIEQKAKEIFMLAPSTPWPEENWKEVPENIKDGLYRIARHVLASEIRARKEEIGIYHEIPGKNLWYLDRTKELEKQLAEIEAA